MSGFTNDSVPIAWPGYFNHEEGEGVGVLVNSTSRKHEWQHKQQNAG
jgi:hypothetical protein